jgi:hypothetical protein
MVANRWRALAAVMVAVGLAGGAGVGLRSGPVGAQDEATRPVPPLAVPVPDRPEPRDSTLTAGPGSVLPVTDRPEPSEDAPHVCKTTNFCVEGPNRRIAQLVAEMAERHRTEQAESWLRRELPPWPEPCRIKVTITMNGTGAATVFDFDRGRVRSRQMTLEGPLDRLLANALPHEVTHTVFADFFGAPLPRWADEGAAILSENDQEQERHEALMRRKLNAGDAIRLRTLLPLKEFPKDVMTLYAQGYSLTRFLVDRKDRPTFLAFVKDGLGGDWDAALKRHYGFGTVEDLEKDWLASLRPARQKPAGQPLDRLTDDASDEGLRSPPPAPAPLIGRASLSRTGELFVSWNTTSYREVTRYVPVGDEFRPVTSFELRVQPVTVMHRPDEMRVFALNGQAVGTAKLTERLRSEGHLTVLVSADGKPVDPFYLSVVKPGTLILALPGPDKGGVRSQPQPPAEAVPPPTPIRE